MKNIRFALVAAVLAAGTAAVASAQQAPPAQVQGAHVRGAHGARKAGPGRPGGQFLKGIQLSAAEKANLKNVNAKYAPQMKALREQSKPQMQAMRDARQRGDTAAVRTLRQQAMSQRGQQMQGQKQLFEAQRNDLRNALSPANQAKFDANVAQAQQRMAKHSKKSFGKNGAHRAADQNPGA